MSYVLYLVIIKLNVGGVPFRSVPVFANSTFIIQFPRLPFEPDLWDTPEREIRAFHSPPQQQEGELLSLVRTAMSWHHSTDHTAVPRDRPLLVPPSSFPSRSDFYSVLHSCQNPKFFHVSLCLLMLFPPPRLPFPTFAKTPLAHSLRLWIDSISSTKCSPCHCPSPLHTHEPYLHSGPLCIAVVPPCAERDTALSPLLCAGWGHHCSSVHGCHLSPSAVCSSGVAGEGDHQLSCRGSIGLL